MEAPIKAGYMEELRFGKRQQWAVATAAIALMAGAFHLADGMKPLLNGYEKSAVTLLVIALMVGGIWLIFDLQRHLAKTRRIIDRDDVSPYWRGIAIARALAIAQGIAAVAVIYSLWRGTIWINL
jgi:hypothetical protein